MRVNRLNTGIFLNPHIQKRHKGGEDAAAVTSNLIAVCDGVGGWAESGIDPANFSRRMCQVIQALTMQDEDKYITRPRDLMVDAVGLNKEIGSATCVITGMDKFEAQLHTANLGDSGYMILRKSGMDLLSIYRTKEQQHSWNFPYQIGTSGDDPAKAEIQTHDVEHNDILIVGSDGLFDNLYDAKIIDLIRPFVRERDDILDVGLVAEIIAKEAENYSYNQQYLSPFAKGAQDNFYDFMGGKADDITVAIAQIQLAGNETEKRDLDEDPVDV